MLLTCIKIGIEIFGRFESGCSTQVLLYKLFVCFNALHPNQQFFQSRRDDFQSSRVETVLLLVVTDKVSRTQFNRVTPPVV